MASGEEPLERYPGSIMLSYSKKGEFPIYYDIEYGTNDAYDKVGNWFRSNLQSQGWNITYQSGSSDTIELHFEKGDDNVVIYIGAPTEGRRYTVIHVAYTMYSRLPDYDLVNGTEPMERHPGAVMIEYSNSTMNVQGINGTEIKVTYLAPGNFETVKQWYLNMLNTMLSNMGGSYGVYDYGESIDAGCVCGNKTIEIHIDFIIYSSYVEVDINYVTTESG